MKTAEKLRFVAIAACVYLTLSATAFAGIREYNAHVKAGDYKAAAAEAMAIWAGFNKTLPEAAVTAREFAWTSMQAGDSEKAKVFATFLVEQGANLPKPDDDPLLSKVLLGWANLGDEPSRDDRAKFSATINAWMQANPTMGSRVAALAAGNLYGKAWQAGDWGDVERDAKMAEVISARLGVEGVVLQHQAIVDAAAANFMATREPNGWMRIADAMDALVVRLPPPRPGMGLDIGQLEPVHWRARAWMDAMSAYFRVGSDRAGSSMAYKRDGDAIEKRAEALKGRCGDMPCPVVPLEAGQLPRCEAEWVQTPKLQYPPSARFKGMIGATILRLTVDEAGKVTDAKVLAAVPSETFPDAAMNTVKRWILKRVDNAGPPCAIAGTRELSLQFRLD